MNTKQITTLVAAAAFTVAAFAGTTATKPKSPWPRPRRSP